MVHHYGSGQRPVGGQEAPNISAGLFALASNDSGIDGTSGFFPLRVPVIICIHRNAIIEQIIY